MQTPRVFDIDVTKGRTRLHRLPDVLTAIFVGGAMSACALGFAASADPTGFAPLSLLATVLSPAPILLIYNLRRADIWRCMRDVWIEPFGLSLFDTWNAVKRLRRGDWTRFWAIANTGFAVVGIYGAVVVFGDAADLATAPPLTLPLGAMGAFCAINATRLYSSGGPLLEYSTRHAKVALGDITRSMSILAVSAIAAFAAVIPVALIVENAEISLPANQLWIVAALVGCLFLGTFLLTGHLLRKRTDASVEAWIERQKADARASAEHVLANDSRAPIIYLRAFDDDHVSIDAKPEALSIDEIIAAELRPMGPFIAIGKPGELRRAGAARAYYGNDAWQGAIADLMDRAQMIVAVPGWTPGLQWELSAIASRKLEKKTVFVIPPKNRDKRTEWLHKAFAGTKFGELLRQANLSRATVLHKVGDDLLVTNGSGQRHNYEVGMVAAAYAVHLFQRRSAAPIRSGLLGAMPPGLADTIAVYWEPARGGDAHALSCVAWAYDCGNYGISPDLNEAARIYRLAADRGDKVAQNNLAHLYEDGLAGLEKNPNEAARLYELAANQGYGTAMESMARFYELGVGGLPKSLDKAIHWFKRAARTGDTRAQDRLKGMGVRW